MHKIVLLLKFHLIMRISTSLLCLVLLPFILSATEPEKKIRCAHTEHIEFLKSRNPDYERQMQHDEAVLQEYIDRSAVNRASNTIYTIPVVVHVIYKTAAQNISNAQIQSQIDVLNEDFARRNADTVNTPAAFRSVASGTNFQFCLAKRDPNGAATNGIERRQTTVSSWDLDDLMKSYSTGGLDAWDVNKYLNIWVCNLGGGILGYAELPSINHANTYGVVVQYDAFGKGGVAAAPYHLGRTCTHEISHCFRLFHIWGDDFNSCTGSDNVADTPNQSDATFGCSNWPKTDNCSSTSPGIMYMNYMDYSDDNCLNMFTINQSTRMTSSMNAYYPSLLNSDGCQDVTGIEEYSRFIDMSVYPNPSDGMITIDMLNAYNIGSELRVRVTDAIGRVQSESLITSPNGTLHQVDLSACESGVYFITLYNDDYQRTERITLSR